MKIWTVENEDHVLAAFSEKSTAIVAAKKIVANGNGPVRVHAAEVRGIALHAPGAGRITVVRYASWNRGHEAFSHASVAAVATRNCTVQTWTDEVPADFVVQAETCTHCDGQGWYHPWGEMDCEAACGACRGTGVAF